MTVKLEKIALSWPELLLYVKKAKIQGYTEKQYFTLIVYTILYKSVWIN